MQATERRYLSYTESEVYTGLHRVTLWRAARSGPFGYPALPPLPGSTYAS
jgi:hypothetical protein